MTTEGHSTRLPSHHPARSHRLILWLLPAVACLALSLRLTGLDWGSPWAFHPDEIYYVDRAQMMVQSGRLNPNYFRNPSLFTYLVAGELAMLRAFGALAGPLASDLPGSAHLAGRLASGLIGTLSVLVVFAIGSRLYGQSVGLVGALLLAVSFLHVRDSHYAVSDVPGTGLLLLSIYFAVRLLCQPRLRWYVLAGLAGGLATSTKYSMGFFFVPLLLAHGLRSTGSVPGRGRGPKWFLAVASLAAVAGFILGTPYSVLDFEEFQEDFSEQLKLGDSRWHGQSLEPVPLLFLSTLLQGLGAVPIALSLVGLTLAWWNRRVETILLVSFPLVYLSFMLTEALFFARFALPLIPFACLFASYGAVALVEMLRPAWRPAALRGLVALALVQPLANGLLHNRLIAQTDTRILASRWVLEHLPPDSRLKMSEYTLRDTSGKQRTFLPSSIERRIGPFEPGPNTDEASDFVRNDVQFVVISSYGYERYWLDPLPRERESDERYQRLYRSLEQEAELVARFSPGLGGREVPFSLDNVYTPFWNLEQHERPGPTIRIYSLTPHPHASQAALVGEESASPHGIRLGSVRLAQSPPPGPGQSAPAPRSD